MTLKDKTACELTYIVKKLRKKLKDINEDMAKTPDPIAILYSAHYIMYSEATKCTNWAATDDFWVNIKQNTSTPILFTPCIKKGSGDIKNIFVPVFSLKNEIDVLAGSKGYFSLSAYNMFKDQTKIYVPEFLSSGSADYTQMYALPIVDDKVYWTQYQQASKQQGAILVNAEFLVPFNKNTDVYTLPVDYVYVASIGHDIFLRNDIGPTFTNVGYSTPSKSYNTTIFDGSKYLIENRLGQGMLYEIDCAWPLPTDFEKPTKPNVYFSLTPKIQLYRVTDESPLLVSIDKSVYDAPDRDKIIQYTTNLKKDITWTQVTTGLDNNFVVPIEGNLRSGTLFTIYDPMSPEKAPE